MKKHLLLIVLLLLYKFSAAQQAGEVDLNFNPNDNGNGVGLNNYALVSSTQSDGKILIAGGFSSFKNHRANGILRLNTDGTFDESFVVDTIISNNDKTIYSLSVLPNNKIIIAGNITNYQGSGRNYLIRLFPNGSIDTSFNPSSISNTAIYTTILPDGKLLVSHLDGKYLSKLNEDGSLDTSFNIGSGANNYVNMMSIAANNSIILTGNFDKFNGQPCYGVIKLLSNGNIDQNFITEKINSLSTVHYVDLSGKIYIAGYFDSVANHKRNGIARLNSNGSLDLSYDLSQYLSLSNQITSISGQSDGKIYLAGDINLTNSESTLLIRVNSDGTLDTSFSYYLTEDFVDAFHISLTNENKIILTGNIRKYNNKRLGNYVKLLQDGTIDYAFHKETGVGGIVRSIEKYGPNKILIAGDFGSYNGNDSLQNIVQIPVKLTTSDRSKLTTNFISEDFIFLL